MLVINDDKEASLRVQEQCAKYLSMDNLAILLYKEFKSWLTCIWYIYYSIAFILDLFDTAETNNQVN